MNSSESTTSSVGQVAVPVTTRQTGRRILVNTSALTISNLWRIVISFGLQVLIARQLGVEASGQYTIVLAYLNVCQVLSELGLPALLVRDLAQRPAQRRSYFYLALWMQGVASLVIWGVLAVTVLWLPLSPATRLLLWVVGASLPFYAVTSVTQTLFQAGERLEFILGIEVLINTSILLCSAVSLWLGYGILQLIAVLVVTQALSALFGVWLVRDSTLLAAPQEPLAANVRRLRQQATPFYGLAIADVLLQRTDILLLSVIGGETVTGIYGLAYQFIRVILKLVQSFWKALYPTFSRLYSQVRSQYERLAGLSLALSVFALLMAAALGTNTAQPLLHLLFGARYLPTVPVFQVLLWSTPFFLLESYVSVILLVEQRPRISLMISALHLLALVILLPPLAWSGGASGAAWAVLCAVALSALFSLWWLSRTQLAIDFRRLLLMAGAALIVGVIDRLTPAPWYLHLGIGGLIFIWLTWQLKLITPADWQTLRRVL
jgi:O-antigen/teichoic acid export membrane protein